jgi:hypothetical protein
MRWGCLPGYPPRVRQEPAGGGAAERYVAGRPGPEAGRQVWESGQKAGPEAG